MFLKCREIWKDYKFKRNPFKMLNAHFLVTLEALNLLLCQKRLIRLIQLICLTFKNICFNENFKEKSKNFETQFIVCYSRFIALHFQPLQPVSLTGQCLTVYKTRMKCLIRKYLLLSVISKKEKKTWKAQYRSAQWKI